MKRKDIINFVLMLGPFILVFSFLICIFILEKGCKSEADCKIREIQKHERQVFEKVVKNCLKEFNPCLCRRFNYSPTAIKVYYNLPLD